MLNKDTTAKNTGFPHDAIIYKQVAAYIEVQYVRRIHAYACMLEEIIIGDSSALLELFTYKQTEFK